MQQEPRNGQVVLKPVSGGQIRIGGKDRHWEDWMGRQAYKYRVAVRPGHR